MSTLHKASPVVCFIKAIFPLINYDDEPSVSMGIMSQLPSFHLLIHRVPAKLFIRVMPYGENFCQLQLLFDFDFLTLPAGMFTDFSGRVSMLHYRSLCDEVQFALHR